MGQKSISRWPGCQFAILMRADPMPRERTHLAAASSVVTFIVQQKGGAVQAFTAFSFGVRVTNALLSYVKYIGKMLCFINKIKEKIFFKKT